MCPMSLIKEMNIKATMKYHLLSVRIDSSRRQEITNAHEDLEKKKPLCIIRGNVNWYSRYRKLYGVSSKK